MNFCGQLGLGDNNDRSSPEKLTKLINEGTKFIKIACGSEHTILLDDKNEV